MQQDQINQLIRIYNTFTTISTKGEDTITMADCLKAFRTLLLEIQEDFNNSIRIPIEGLKIEEEKE